MSSYDEDHAERRVFGIPAVLTSVEISRLVSDLTIAWSACYAGAPGSLDADLALCRKYFDPVARGHTLRQRLAELSAVPDDAFRRLRVYGEPLTIVAGDGLLLAGIEARLVLDLLSRLIATEQHVISRADAADAEDVALRTYREWDLRRLRQVIDLRAGAGPEVLQAVAVGLVLALLVNRSDSLERAVIRWDSITPDGKDVDQALYDGAESFARAISSRFGRSDSDKRLKGGYGLTEARRRLAHRLVVTPESENGGSRIYIPQEYRDEVVSFLAHDLARRSALTLIDLEIGFDELVDAFRFSARALAYRSMIFERASETDKLKSDLLNEFVLSRQSITAR